MKRLVRPVIGAGLVLALAATPALASHAHVMAIGTTRTWTSRPRLTASTRSMYSSTKGSLANTIRSPSPAPPPPTRSARPES